MESQSVTPRRWWCTGAFETCLHGIIAMFRETPQDFREACRFQGKKAQCKRSCACYAHFEILVNSWQNCRGSSD